MKSYEMLLLVVVRGVNRSTKRKASQSKAGTEKTQIKYGVEAGIEPRPHWWKTNAHAILE